VLAYDYVDLHAILTIVDVGIGDLVRALDHKYPGKDVGFALRALGYFADVDKARDARDAFQEPRGRRSKTDSRKARRCVALMFEPRRNADPVRLAAALQAVGAGQKIGPFQS